MMADMHTPLPWRVDHFFETFRILHNLNLWDLEEAGVITPGAKGGSDWKRFNGDLTTFMLKLPSARVEKLFLLVESRLPNAPSQDAETIKALREALRKAETALDDLANGRGVVSPIEQTITVIRAALAGSAS